MRRTFDERLLALEAGLADPGASPALDSLVLDLVRAAADEAEAAARDASLRAQRSAEAMLATAMAETQAAHVKLDDERARTESLRSEIASQKKQFSTTAQFQQSLDEANRRAAASADRLASASARAEAAIRERDAMAAQRGTLVHERDAMAASRDALAAERDALLADRDALAADRGAIAADRDAIAAERDAIAADRDAVAAERDAAAAERAMIARGRDTAVAERDALTVERDTLAAERTALAAECSALIADRDALAAARDAVTGERDTLVAERNALATERDAQGDDRQVILAERDALALERQALLDERRGLMTARDSLTEERDALMRERADFVRTHDAMILQRDTLVHERDDIARERDRQIAQLHGDLAAREAALKDARTTAAAGPAAAKHSSAGAPADGPVRKADRQAFGNALGVQIDGEAALLVNLSVTGAQVLSCSALKPTKTVKMLLPSSDAPVLCRGRIVWARLEPTMPGRPIRYRAGMFFTASDQAAVQTFMTRHGAHVGR